MSAGNLLGGVMLGGVAWLWWRQRAAAASAPQGATLQLASYAPQGSTQESSGAAGQALGSLFGDVLGMLNAPTPEAQTQTGTGAQVAPTRQGGNMSLDDLFSGLFGGNTGPATAGTASAQGGGVAGLLNVIASGESGRAGYDAVYARCPISPPMPISQMTVGDVLGFQSQMLAAGSASSAVGRYQFLRGTLQGLVNQGTLRTSEVFNAAAQDHAATALMQRRGLGDYQAGTISAQTFANNLAKEWASLPVTTGSKAGASYYSGDGLNAARVSVSSILGAVQGVA